MLQLDCAHKVKKLKKQILIYWEREATEIDMFSHITHFLRKILLRVPLCLESAEEFSSYTHISFSKDINSLILCIFMEK